VKNNINNEKEISHTVDNIPAIFIESKAIRLNQSTDKNITIHLSNQAAVN
jgi:hypothetical protein